MGNIVTLNRHDSRNRQLPDTATDAAPPALLAPGATMFAAGMAVAWWWTAAWRAGLRFGDAPGAERPAPAPAPVVRTPLLRLHVNTARLRADAGAWPLRGRSM